MIRVIGVNIGESKIENKSKNRLEKKLTTGIREKEGSWFGHKVKRNCFVWNITEGEIKGKNEEKTTDIKNI